MSVDKINNNFETLSIQPAPKPQSSPAPMIEKPVSKIQINQSSSISLHGRITNYLDDLEKRLDSVPNNCYQEKMDAIGESIEKQFSKLDGLNTWLDDNGQGEWYKQLATFLYKLPVRAVRNIIKLVYSLIKEILSFAVHPLKQLTKLARMLVNLVVELTKPEVWAKIGAGVVGASLGQAAVGCPLSIVGIGIGAAMLIGGLTVTAVKAALKANVGKQFDDAKEAVINVSKELPEVMLTGFLVGLLMGAIRKTVSEEKQIRINEQRNVQDITVDNREQLTIQWGRDFAVRERLPTPDFVRYNPNTHQTVLGWKYNFATEHTILRTHPWWGFNYLREGGQTYSIAGILPEPYITNTYTTMRQIVITPAHTVTATTSKVVPAVGSGGPLLGSATAIKA